MAPSWSKDVRVTGFRMDGGRITHVETTAA
jgi:hypothetical protein